MPKFTVTLEETVYYKIEVEADDEAGAEAAAEEAFVQADDTNEFFFGVGERIAASVELHAGGSETT